MGSFILHVDSAPVRYGHRRCSICASAEVEEPPFSAAFYFRSPAQCCRRRIAVCPRKTSNRRVHRFRFVQVNTLAACFPAPSYAQLSLAPVVLHLFVRYWSTQPRRSERIFKQAVSQFFSDPNETRFPVCF